MNHCSLLQSLSLSDKIESVLHINEMFTFWIRLNCGSLIVHAQ